MTRRTISAALILAGVVVGVAVTVTASYMRSQLDRNENLDAITATAPRKILLVRLMAPDDGCWTRTIGGESNVEDEVAEGCGPVTFSVRYRKDVNISFERRPHASWTWCLSAAAGGRVVLNRGPDSSPDYSLEVYFDGKPPRGRIEPVACAES